MKHRLRLTQQILVLSWLLVYTQTSHAAAFQYPLAVVVDMQGAIFVADRKLPGIWKITDKRSETYFQGSKKFRTPLNAIRCLAIDQKGHLLAGDSSTREVYRFTDQGKPVPLTQGQIGIPMAMTVHKSGRIYVADLETHSIVTIPSTGGAPEVFQTGLAVRGLTFDQDDHLLVVAHGKDQLIAIALDRKQKVLLKDRAFQFPHHVIRDDQGALYLADGYAKKIWKVPAKGANRQPDVFITHSEFKNPVGLYYHDKKFYVADPQAKTIFVFDKTATLKSKIPEK